MGDRPFRITGPEDRIRAMAGNTLVHWLGSAGSHEMGRLKLPPEKLTLNIKAVKVKKHVSESTRLVEFDFLDEESRFEVDISSRKTTILFGRLGRYMGNDGIIFVDGREIADVLKLVVDEYREGLLRDIQSAKYLPQDLETFNKEDKKRWNKSVLQKNGDELREFENLANKAHRIMTIKYFALHINAWLHTADGGDTIAKTGHPDFALIFPERFDCISAAAGILDLIDMTPIGDRQGFLVDFTNFLFFNQNVVTEDMLTGQNSSNSRSLTEFTYGNLTRIIVGSQALVDVQEI